jgi:hypothetical protein
LTARWNDSVGENFAIASSISRMLPAWSLSLPRSVDAITQVNAHVAVAVAVNPYAHVSTLAHRREFVMNDQSYR